MKQQKSKLTRPEQALLVRHFMKTKKYECANKCRRDVYFGKWDHHAFAQDLLKKRMK